MIESVDCTGFLCVFLSRGNTESTEGNNGSASPGTQNRFSGFRPASARSSTCTTPSKANESDRPLWNSANIEQKTMQSPVQNGITRLVQSISPRQKNFLLFRLHDEDSRT